MRLHYQWLVVHDFLPKILGDSETSSTAGSGGVPQFRYRRLTRTPANTMRIIIFLLAVAAIVIVMFVTGWADDKASPGGGGRVPVPETGADDSR